nr:cytochrome p450 71a1 [Quercus suber]
MFSDLGCAPTVVVSTAEMAIEIIKKNDIIFSNQPETTAANFLYYGSTDVAFSQYGEYRRQAKKICVLKLRGLKRVQSFQYVREKEVEVSIKKIRDSCLKGASINPRFIPSLKSSFGEIYAFLDQVVQQHMITKVDDGLPKKNDFVDSLLELRKSGKLDFELTHKNLKALLLVSCVQENVADRPTMSDVVVMLSNESTALPYPKQPAFLNMKSVMKAKTDNSRAEICSVTDATVSIMEGR